ncbi:MAG: hypothetical protein ABJB40_06530 [Acidobacteriota bacterium]
MKRILVIAILAVSAGIAVFGAGARGANSPAPNYGKDQVIDQILRGRRHHRRWNSGNNNNNVRYETRVVHKGNKTYRDTYRITWKNGREKQKRVSHVRIG